VTFHSLRAPRTPLSGNRMRKTLLFLCGFFLLAQALPAAAQFNGPPLTSSGDEMNRPVQLTTDPALLFPPSQDTILQAGDSVTVRLYGEADYSPSGRIDSDGNIELPLIGIVHLGGLTVSQANHLIAERMVEAGMFRDPQVTIVLADGTAQSVTVIGEIRGVVPGIGKRRLLDVLAVSGGLPATASHVIAIDRPGVQDPILVDLGSDPLHSRLADVPVFPGDTIVVSRIGIVYILGAFKAPGVIPLNSYSPLTLIEATTLSGGGVLFQGKSDDLRIIRTVGSRRTVAVYNIKKVLNGEVPDPILQPNDIVYLPTSPWKNFFASGTLGTVLGLASFAISLETLR
jgi:polysaccharide export outer membrane protein